MNKKKKILLNECHEFFFFFACFYLEKVNCPEEISFEFDPMDEQILLQFMAN